MHRRLIFVLSLALCLGLILGQGASAQRIKAIPVTSTVADFNPNTFDGYRLQSDLLGAYKNGVDSVVSQIQSSGDWEMNTMSSPTRRIFVDFGSPASDGATAPFSTAYIPARFITKCGALDTDPFRTLRGVGSAQLCPLGLSFDYGGQTYRLSMNSVWHPGTDNALVTCVGVTDPNNPGTSPCNHWRLQPTGTDGQQAQNRARLLRLQTAKRGATQEVAVGDFYMTFDLTVNNP